MIDPTLYARERSLEVSLVKRFGLPGSCDLEPNVLEHRPQSTGALDCAQSRQQALLLHDLVGLAIVEGLDATRLDRQGASM